MSRILVFVPNPATSDRRVIRHAESLVKAGHDVEIVGVATVDKFARQAITDEQIPVTRVAWRASAYRKVLMGKVRKLIVGALIGIGLLTILGLSDVAGLGTDAVEITCRDARVGLAYRHALLRCYGLPCAIQKQDYMVLG